MIVTDARRGCRTCRKRHEECENGGPHCRTCLHAGIYCDGYQTDVTSEEDLPPIRPRPRQTLRRLPPGPLEEKPQPEIHQVSLPDPDETELVAAGYNDEWLRTRWPPQLPVAIRLICQGVGRDNIALRCAVFSLGHIPPNFNRDTPSEKMAIALNFHRIALEHSIKELHSGGTPELGLKVTIFSVLALIEMKLGSFRSGLVNVKQAGKVITANQTAFCSPGPHRDVMQAWFPINAWYSIQCPPWDVLSRTLTAETLKASWGILRASTDKAHEIGALLCESRRLYARLSLFRLIESSGISSEDMAGWPRSFKKIVSEGGSVPEEESSPSALAVLRDGLDSWENSVDERPVYAKTASLKAQLDSEPPSVRFEPLSFQSYHAAINYARYAAAQALCSHHSLDVLTGKTKHDDSYTDEWIHLILQIVAGLSSHTLVNDEDNYPGLMWILAQVVALRCTDPHIISWIQKKVPFLETIMPDWGCVIPKRMFGPLLAMQKDLLARGRVMTHLFTEDSLEAKSKWQGKRVILRVGLDLATGKGFFEWLSETSLVAMV